MGKFYSEMYELRQTGDYDDWKTLSESDIMPLIPKVEQFLDVVEKLIIADGDMD